MDRKRGLSVRLKLTLSYAGLVMLAGTLLLSVVWIFALRWVPYKNDPRDFHKPPGATMVVMTGPSLHELLRGLIPAAAIAMACLLVFGLTGGWFLAGRMLSPLTRITEATRMAATGSLSHRIELTGSQDEFRELADAFDVMLAQLEAHVAEQRRFAANASHELRTPLAVTRSLLDAARYDPTRDGDELLHRLRVVNTRAIDLTEALLLLSRADRRTFHREEVDLSLLAEDATETLLPLAEKRHVAIETSGDVAATFGSPTLLQQLVTNLVHNAIVHNLPAQGTVWVTTSALPEGVVLTIENTGENLTEELVPTLTEPFQRGTNRIHRDHVGVGLGLAIAKSITQAHDGTLVLTPRATGGLLVTVRLPAAAASRRTAAPPAPALQVPGRTGSLS